MQQRYRRKKKLIEPRLQLKFALVFFATASIAVLVQAAMLTKTLVDMAAKMPYDGSKVMADLPSLLTFNLLVTFSILVPLALGIGILGMFRVAGPIYRFRMFLNQVIAGEKPADFRLRKGDELHELCALLNEATAPLRVRACLDGEGQQQETTTELESVGSPLETATPVPTSAGAKS
jgi:hypothetical protein